MWTKGKPKSQVRATHARSPEIFKQGYDSRHFCCSVNIAVSQKMRTSGLLRPVSEFRGEVRHPTLRKRCHGQLPGKRTGQKLPRRH